ncbi:hypothetical protein GUJ93_ZPchr0001g32268 [Zizania palustris]|uniref:Uncharacterized protein n=1 Tax=Zizania palustris TaxID=103762 RepID=A0A8J5RSW8_ZIZPA|nr:hypothetical protein GUJ93_ZPchr0001g32268 [Zizania palustris]
MAATGEELYESDVLWPDHQQAPRDVPSPSAPPAAGGPSTALAGRYLQPCPATASSRPVDIPRAARRRSGADQADDDVRGTMVPPHVMVSRRRSEGEPGAAAFSLRSGTGRARRDLSHLRNSVLRMTGFIEG